MAKSFFVEKGFYSSNKNLSDLERISYKYKDATFTSYSAFYYLGLTDVIPSYFYLQTKKNARKIENTLVKQMFENSQFYETGKVELVYGGVKIKTFNKERMFIELVRNKNKIPFDYYKEIMLNYRRVISKLDLEKIEDYARKLPKTNMVLDALQLEVL